MGEGAVDDLAPGGDRGERGDVAVRPPPVRAVDQRDAGAHEQDPTGGRRPKGGPQRVESEAALDRRVALPSHGRR